jgi:hypothetical protein
MKCLGWLVILGEVGIERGPTNGRYPMIILLDSGSNNGSTVQVHTYTTSPRALPMQKSS